jgi:hypothetical protein
MTVSAGDCDQSGTPKKTPIYTYFKAECTAYGGPAGSRTSLALPHWIRRVDQSLCEAALMRGGQTNHLLRLNRAPPPAT